ncbi:polymorphic toxin-type HINT domain-containing protein [Tundrisphaera lichenicola]|uniref:polymorphic toxin-type HINT domain-containing protein n=1 Tax=Tundrisphaera lichenicola TaxID=2029860 RepID=UPI003EB9AA61
MLTLVALMSLLAVPDGPSSEVTQAYQEARAGAGRSSEDQVRLALWCEAHGLTRERLNHLAVAVLADPQNATARGLMGLVAYQGRFLRPEAVADRARMNPALAEYDERRMKAPYTAEGQWSMGVWAEDRGLKEQARAHFTAVTRLDPTRENAWRRLGFKKQGRRWVTDAQLLAEKAEAEAQKQADKDWKARIDRYRAMLDQPSKRDEAEAALLAITDPRAVPSVVGSFVSGRHTDPLRAVQLLGQIDSPSASRAMAALAVFDRSAEVRRVAVETLRWRDPRDFVRLWIGLIRDPIKFQVQPVGGPGSPGSLVIEGPKADLKRVYAPPAMPQFPILPGARLSYDANGLPVITETIGVERVMVVNQPFYNFDGQQVAAAVTQAAKGGDLGQILKDQAAAGRPAQAIGGYLPGVITGDGFRPIDIRIGRGTQQNLTEANQEKDLQIPIGQMRLEAQRSAEMAQRQLSGDVAAIEQANAAVRRSNEPVLQALQAVTGKDLGDDALAWSKWWTDQEGYAYAITQTAERPTIVETVPLAFTPTAIPQIVTGVTVAIRHACFAAGTTVRTIEGDRAIETVRAGDLVLAQDTGTGALTYQPVVTAFHNPPSATLRIGLGEDTVVATGIHRFWKAGQGWVMARDLRVGDPVRTLGGVAKVKSVKEDEGVQPVFNLEVAEGHSFLVGRLGALVHDNSLVEPVLNPFDAPAVAVASKVAR